MPSAMDGSLEHSPYRLDSVGVDIASDVFASRVLDGIVGEAVEDRRQSGVGAGFVCVDRRTRLYRSLDESDQRGRVHLLDRLGGHFAASLPNADHGGFAYRTASGVEFLVAVLVGFLAAEIRFVDFHDLCQLEVASAARFADAMEHMPRRPILASKLFRQLHRANALAGCHHRVDGVYPVLQGALGGVHAGLGRDGELLPAVLVPVVAGLARRLADVLDSAAVRADRSAVPSGRFQPRVAGVLVGEHAE